MPNMMKETAMRQMTRMMLGAALLAPVTVAAQSRQTERDAFRLSERVPANAWIRVRNINGEMRVRASSSDKVEITATKTWRRGDPRDVSIETKKGADGSILICAIWAETET